MSLILFFAALVFLVSGMPGTIPSYRDSGDLIASVHTLGIAHPPGYAVYVILGKLFHVLVPFGNPAYKTNLLSAVCGALAAAGLFTLLRREASRGIAAVLAIVFVCASSVITLSRVSEMYTMALVFGVAILYVAWSEVEYRAELSGFLLGIGFHIHPTLLCLFPVVIAVALERVIPPGRHGGIHPIALGPGLRIAGATRVVLFGLLGFSIGLYLPLRSLQHPVQNWGDPSTWRQFWRVLTRADYGGLKLHPEQSVFIWSAGGVFHQLAYLAKALAKEWGVGALILGIVGWGVLWQRPAKRWMALSGAASLVLAGPLFFLLSNLPLNEATTPAILEPYLLIPGLLLMVGTAIVLERLLSRQRVVALVVAVTVVAMAPWQLTAMHQRSDFKAYDYGRNLLRSLPPNAALYDPDDPTSFTLRALQVTQNRRLDVVLLNFLRTRWGYEDMRRRWPDLLPPVPMENAQQLQAALWNYSATRRPFYGELPQKLAPHPYRTEGLAYRVLPTEDRTDGNRNWSFYALRGVARVDAYSDFFSRHQVGYYAAAHCNLALDYANAGQIEKATFHYKAALAIDPALAAAWINWGNLFYAQKKYKEALTLYEEGLRRVPGNAGLQANRELVLSMQRAIPVSFTSNARGGLPSTPTTGGASGRSP